MPGEKMKKKGMNLRPYIMRVIHQYSPGHGIKKSAMDNMNSIALNIMKSLTRESAELMEHGKQKVMQTSTLSAAIKMKFPGRLAELANTEAMYCVDKYKAYTKKDEPQDVPPV